MWQIKSRAGKELFERERGSERPWVKGISFYLIAPEGDLDSWKERADPMENPLFRPEYWCLQVGGGNCSACLSANWCVFALFFEYCGQLPWNLSHSLATTTPFSFFKSPSFQVEVTYLKSFSCNKVKFNFSVKNVNFALRSI